jgi:hypothetical protein
MSPVVRALGWALSAGAVLYVVLGIEWDQVGQVLTGIELEALALAAAIYLSTFAIRGLRWADLLRGPIGPRVRPATVSFLVGFAANHVFPARLGDIVRAFALRRLANVPVATGISSVFVERVIDGLVVVGLGTLALALAPPDSTWARPMLGLFGAGFFTALVGCGLAVVLAARPRFFPRLRRHPRVERVLLRVVDGMRTVTDPLRLLRVLALTAVIWLVELGVYVVLARALGVDLPAAALMGVMVGLTLGLVAPSAPAFVGVFEGLVIAGLAAYGIDEGRALAFALTLHVVHGVPGTVLGVLLAARHGVRLDRRGDALPSEPPDALRTGGRVG